MKVVAAPPMSDPSMQLSLNELGRYSASRIVTESDCGIDVSIGCFFDGTRNHRLASKKREDMSESNVSRLFDVYDLERAKGVGRRPTNFASYIQGVGTEALKEIGDTGTGWHARAGAAAGWGGEGRVNWMLMQVQDHLLTHFAETTVTTAMGFDSTVPVARKMSADLRLRLQDVERLAQAARMSLSNYLAVNQGQEEIDLRNSLSGGFWNMVHALQRVRGTHLARADHVARRAVLQERRLSGKEGGAVPEAESPGGSHPDLGIRLLARRHRGARILQLARRFLRPRSGAAAPVWHSSADRFHGAVRYGGLGRRCAELL